jgi:hypothetical protein
MSDTERTSMGRRFFNGLAAVVLILFALFSTAIAVGVASIPHLRRAAEERAEERDRLP